MNFKSNKITIGKVELDDLEFAPHNVKVRITTMIDEDLLKALKKIAKSSGKKYQTLLNQILRSYIERKKNTKPGTLEEKRIRQIVREEIRKKA